MILALCRSGLTDWNIQDSPFRKIRFVDLTSRVVGQLIDGLNASIRVNIHSVPGFDGHPGTEPIHFIVPGIAIEGIVEFHKFQTILDRIAGGKLSGLVDSDLAGREKK